MVVAARAVSTHASMYARAAPTPTPQRRADAAAGGAGLPWLRSSSTAARAALGGGGTQRRRSPVLSPSPLPPQQPRGVAPRPRPGPGSQQQQPQHQPQHRSPTLPSVASPDAPTVAAPQQPRMARRRGRPLPLGRGPQEHDIHQEVQPISEQTLSDCASAFSSVLNEYAYWVDDAWVEGAIPTDLLGTYFRNGPGIQVESDTCTRHPLDGDGMVLSVAFKDGKAYFRNRFVKTKGFLDEQAAGRPLYRTTFSSGSPDGSKLFNPFDLTFKNVSNTGVLHWAGRLYTMWEAGRPYELHPSTLETLGETDVDGSVHGPLAGHYRVVGDASPGAPPGARRWVTFGTDVGFGGVSVRFYEYDERGACVAESRHKLPGQGITFIHDMMVTENYYVLLLGPINFNIGRFLLRYVFGKASIAQCLEYDPEGAAKVMLFPRPGAPGAASRAPVVQSTDAAFFPFHHVNAYEDGDGRVVMDTVGWNDVDFDVSRFITSPEYYVGGCRPTYMRVAVDPGAPRGAVAPTAKLLVNRTVEFPAVAPAASGRRHNAAFFTADAAGHEHLWGPAQVLLKVSLPRSNDGEPRTASPGCCSGSGGGGGGDSGNSSNIVPGVRLRGALHVVGVPSCAGGASASGNSSCSSSGSNSSSSSSSSAPGRNVACGSGAAACLHAVHATRDAPHSMASELPGVVVDEWHPGPRSFCGEAMLVPRPGAAPGDHDNAWVIVGVHNAETRSADVCILDAADIAAGPVATIHLPHHLPASLHGSFTNEYLGPDPNDASVPLWAPPVTYRAMQ